MVSYRCVCHIDINKTLKLNHPTHLTLIQSITLCMYRVRLYSRNRQGLPHPLYRNMNNINKQAYIFQVHTCSYHPCLVESKWNMKIFQINSIIIFILNNTYSLLFNFS